MHCQSAIKNIFEFLERNFFIISFIKTWLSSE